jgi:hypothetical protein
MPRSLLLSVTLKDCDVQTFRCGGHGGQNVNKRDTGVRIIHRESGAVGESREERSQLQNKKTAFRRMVKHQRFRIWVNRQVWYKGILPEQRAEEDMKPDNLRVEARKEGQWVVIPASGPIPGGTDEDSLRIP